MMSAGRLNAAKAVERRRHELGLTQEQLGYRDTASYRAFARGESWPRPRTRAFMEAALRWPPGKIERLASEDDHHREPYESATDEIEREILDSRLPRDVKAELLLELEEAHAEWRQRELARARETIRLWERAQGA